MSHKHSGPHARSRHPDPTAFGASVRLVVIPTRISRHLLRRLATYISPLIQRAAATLPFGKDAARPAGRADTAKIIANLWEADGHGVSSLPTPRPKEFSHESLLPEVSRVLGVDPSLANRLRHRCS